MEIEPTPRPDDRTGAGDPAARIEWVVERARSGDPDALDELIGRSRSHAVRYAAGILRDEALAEEAVQEALALAVAGLGELRSSAAFVTWFRRIVYRQCDRITRRREVRVVPLSELVEPADTQPTPGELIERAERILAVRAAIDRLPDDQRAATAAYYLGERSQSEAAAALGTTVSTLNNRLHAARRTLERNLAVMNDDNSADTGGDLRLVAPDADRDAERIYSVLDTTGPAGPQWRGGRLGRSRFDWDTSRLGLSVGGVTALVGVYDLSMRIGHSTVRTAGFNLDYEAPDAPAGTLARVTADTVEAARREGYAMAVAVGESAALGAAGFTRGWAESMWFVPAEALGAAAPVATEPFEPVHHEDLAQLADREHDGLTGIALRPTYLANKEPGGFDGRRWPDAADPGNTAAGYVSYAVVESWTNRSLLGPSHRGYDRLLWHDESAGDPDTRLAVLGELAREHRCDEIAFDRLHQRSRLARRLRSLPHRVEQGYRHAAIRVLSVEAALAAIVGEFDRRLVAALGDPVTGAGEIRLRITIDGDGATVLGTRRGVEIVAADGTEPAAIDGDAQLANLFVGTATPDTVLDAAGIAVTGDARRLASVLFPAQDPQMDNQSL